MSQIYEAWGPLEGRAEVFSLRSHFQDGKSILCSSDEEEFIPLYSIRSTSWEDAMEAYNAIQGWGAYVPGEMETIFNDVDLD